MTPGALIRTLRIRHRLSQRCLAYRAGTSQSAISRLERGKADVTWRRLEAILAAMGDQPVLTSKRVPAQYDPRDLTRWRAMTPEARLALAVEINER